jgi:hypothetical protein
MRIPEMQASRYYTVPAQEATLLSSLMREDLENILKVKKISSKGVRAYT